MFHFGFFSNKHPVCMALHCFFRGEKLLSSKKCEEPVKNHDATGQSQWAMFMAPDGDTTRELNVGIISLKIRNDKS